MFATRFTVVARAAKMAGAAVACAACANAMNATATANVMVANIGKRSKAR